MAAGACNWHAKVQLVLWAAPRCVCAFAWGFVVQAAHSRNLPPLSPPGSGQRAGRPASMHTVTLRQPRQVAHPRTAMAHGYDTMLSPHQVRMRVCAALIVCWWRAHVLPASRGTWLCSGGRQRAGGRLGPALRPHHALYGFIVHMFDPTPGSAGTTTPYGLAFGGAHCTARSGLRPRWLAC